MDGCVSYGIVYEIAYKGWLVQGWLVQGWLVQGWLVQGCEEARGTQWWHRTSLLDVVMACKGSWAQAE
jgi:hypothetical protein